jgi:hypothetical protein
MPVMPHASRGNDDRRRPLTLGDLAEFERRLIRARKGRKRAEGTGVRFGRPKKLSAHQRREAMGPDRRRRSHRQSGVQLGIDRATVYRLKP